MNTEQVIQALQSKKLKFNPNGHALHMEPIDAIHVNYARWTSYYLREMASDKSAEDKGYTESWYKHNTETDINKITDHKNYCWNCGREMLMILDDNGVLTTGYWKDENDDGLGDLRIKPLACDFDNSFPKVTINVPTGKLVFVNFFDAEEMRGFPKDIEYDRQNSINHLNGQKRLMEHLAKVGVATCQMGNMSLAFYGNDTEIIGIDDYFEEHIADYEYMKENGEKIDSYDRKNYKRAVKLTKYIKKNNLKKLGEITCEMWRWQCADQSVLDKYDEHPEDNTFTANVTAGEWEVEHYYRTDEDADFYSRMILKK